MNCIIVDDEAAFRMVLADFAKRTPSLNLIAECDNAVDALQVLQDRPIDVVFLDIEMPGMTGIELVQSLDELPQIVLITARKDFGPEAFEYSVTDYLTKPVKYPRFLKALERAKNNLEREKETIEKSDSSDIYIKSDGKIIRLRLDEVYFIEALSDYVIIVTESKKHIVHSTMKGIEKRLSTKDFARVHRSYIVNVKKIDTIEDVGIMMPQKIIPIGASYRNDFLAKLNFL